MTGGLEPGPTFTALVCHGCCCARDDLSASAARQLDVLREAAAAVRGARVRITDCLGPCSSKNVVAIRHRRLDTPGVRHGTTWLGALADDAPLDELSSWLRAGASQHRLPAPLGPHVLVDPMVVPVELLRILPRSTRTPGDATP